MSVFNGEAHVREAIRSVLTQTQGDLEVVVIDDGSMDATWSVLESLDDDRLVRLRNERNEGLASALNRGIRAARGELVARQDADDVSEPDRIALQVGFIDRHPDIGLVGCAGSVVSESGAPIAPIDIPGTDTLEPCDFFGLFFIGKPKEMARGGS